MLIGVELYRMRHCHEQELVNLIKELKDEVLVLSSKVSALKAENSEIRESNSELLKSNEQLCSENETLRSDNKALRLEIESLHNRLDGGANPSKPVFVKANKKVKDEKSRKHRKKGFTRCLEVATNVIYHSVDKCSCGQHLIGGWLYRKRQVVDIPMVNVIVTDHILIARECGACGKLNVPNLADSGLYKALFVI